MNAYSEDLGKKIVEAVERGMPKIEAAKTFGVGISGQRHRAVRGSREPPYNRGTESDEHG